MVVVKTSLFEHIAYSVERGRLRALSESVPTRDVASRLNEPNRIVADLVRPGVVHLNSFHTFTVDTRGARAGLVHRDTTADQDDDPENRADGSLDDEASGRSVKPGSFIHENIQFAMGSGFIFDADKGLILTNQHVIDDADRIDVRLADGRLVTADVVSQDIDTDLAVLRVDADRLHGLIIADSRDVHVGDEVFSLGNPFGLDGTFSRGIVSGLGRRTSVAGSNYQGFIQTDAVINPGNSGGPLVNTRGEVIGVNTAIATESGTFSGVGFAIPSSHVLDLLPTLVSGERVVRSFLGVGAVDVHEVRDAANKLGWDRDDGVIITSVKEKTPAEAIGLRANDILVEIDGRTMAGFEAFRHNIAIVGVGRDVPLVYFRDGELIETRVRLVGRPDNR